MMKTGTLCRKHGVLFIHKCPLRGERWHIIHESNRKGAEYMENNIYCLKKLDDGTESFMCICKTNTDGSEETAVAYVDELTDRVIYLCDDARTDEAVQSIIRNVHNRRVKVKCPSSRNDSPGILVDTELGTLEVAVERREFFEETADKIFVSFIPKDAPNLFADITRVSTDGKSLEAYCIGSLGAEDFPWNPHFMVRKPDIDDFIRQEQAT